jgi:hypothetical protein
MRNENGIRSQTFQPTGITHQRNIGREQCVIFKWCLNDGEHGPLEVQQILVTRAAAGLSRLLPASRQGKPSCCDDDGMFINE